ncbi:DUF885 family protein [Pseudoroseicyclus aestuarii]|uniref:Uncharacterized protein DUF885 n=1 Tax=Pseudoroseicyclus aestuarii TaxID=1795041 RepID=A0A318SNS8_9RHOB|nr:DUF885 family protein [Pseudoroseicyclus aestuarii]PYE82484.1 uncharacterized protein DUF885 [Pseudoroseicyclus aestuarii]
MTDTLDAYLAHRFDWRPVDATFMGAEGHDDRLPRTGPGAAEAELAEIEALLARVEGDSAMMASDRQMLLAELRVEQSALKTRPRHGNPAWHTGEAGFGVISLLLPQSKPWKGAAIAARLAAIPAFLKDGRAAIGTAPTPEGWVRRAQAECAALATFLRADIQLHEAWDAVWSAPAEAAARAFEDYAASLDGLPYADPSCGTAHLELVMREQHRLEFGPAEAAARARDAFDRMGAELEEMARAIDPSTPWQEQIAALSATHAADEAGVMAEVTALDAQGLEAAQGLVTPATGYALDYRFFPDWARTVSKTLYFLFYRSPPAMNPGQGSTYWVSRPGDDMAAYLAANSTAMLKTVHAVHHGSVGHHTQNARARQAPSRLGRLAGTDCVMGLAFLGSGTLIEGWACYVEDLLMEAPGFYSPAECLLLKSFERRNAASVLVDVNIHTGAWSLEEAARFYAEEAGFAPARVAGEVTRNAMFPGSRLMYWIGVEGIRDLRRRWTGTTQGFHDTLLSLGHVPLTTVAEHMGRQGMLAA